MSQTGNGTIDMYTERITLAQDSPGVVTLGSLLDSYSLQQSESVAMSVSIGLATATDEYLGRVDTQGRSYHDVAWEIQIVSNTDESAEDLILYHAAVSSLIASPSTNVPTYLDPTASTVHCDLPNTTTGFVISDDFSPKGRYLYVWYDTSANLGSKVSLDLKLNRLH